MSIPLLQTEQFYQEKSPRHRLLITFKLLSFNFYCYFRGIVESNGFAHIIKHRNRKHIAPVHTVAWALCPAPKDPDADPGLEPQFRVSAVTVVWPCRGGSLQLVSGKDLGDCLVFHSLCQGHNGEVCLLSSPSSQLLLPLPRGLAEVIVWCFWIHSAHTSPHSPSGHCSQWSCVRYTGFCPSKLSCGLGVVPHGNTKLPARLCLLLHAVPLVGWLVACLWHFWQVPRSAL